MSALSVIAVLTLRVTCVVFALITPPPPFASDVEFSTVTLKVDVLLLVPPPVFQQVTIMVGLDELYSELFATSIVTLVAAETVPVRRSPKTNAKTPINA